MRYATLTEEYIDKLWLHIKQARGIFGSLEGRSRETLKQSLLSSYIVLDFPFGYARFDEWIPGEQCSVHFAGWSPDIFRKKGELLIALNHMYSHHGMKRVYARIPTGSKALKHLVESLGFHYEGTEPNYYRVGCVHADRYVIVFEEG